MKYLLKCFEENFDIHNEFITNYLNEEFRIAEKFWDIYKFGFDFGEQINLEQLFLKAEKKIKKTEDIFLIKLLLIKTFD